MKNSFGLRRGIEKRFMRSNACLGIGLASLAFVLSAGSAAPQPVDCGRLAAEISALSSSGQRHSAQYGGTQKQRADLNRAIGQARALGCDRGQFFLFSNIPPQCPSLNAKIQQLQASLAQYEGAGGMSGDSAARRQLIARYNAYCRGQPPASPQPAQRGFFETLFGAFAPNPNPFPSGQQPPFDEVRPQPGEDLTPHGGSQAVCVRSCDGGFFPLPLSVRQADPGQLTGLCRALCPNAEVNVYTRSPSQDISTSVSLDGTRPYSDLPNALKFRKVFDPACTCKPPGQSWAEALSGAEELLGRARKSDIVVTPETSAELAKPRFEKAAQPEPSTEPAGGDDDQGGNNPSAAGPQAGTAEITGPDGVKRHVRIIDPSL